MKLVCIFGPTACYKSETAISIARKYGGEILSCDSVAVYKGFDIGSAKPSKAEQQLIPHHLIDIADPEDITFSVASYQKYADTAIRECISRGVQPVIVGGSGLYADAILRDMSYAVPSNMAVRNELAAEYDKDPVAFKEKLTAVDRTAGERIPLKDKLRLVRAMEVYCISGKPFSSYNAAYIEARKRSRYPYTAIGLTMDRDKLYTRISQRVDSMLERGLLQEAESLYKHYTDKTLPAMQSIGYKQLFAYFDGYYGLKDAVDKIKLDTRHLAKRQLTWFRRDESIRWFNCNDIDRAKQEIEDYIEKEQDQAK